MGEIVGEVNTLEVEEGEDQVLEPKKVEPPSMAGRVHGKGRRRCSTPWTMEEWMADLRKAAAVTSQQEDSTSVTSQQGAKAKAILNEEEEKKEIEMKGRLNKRKFDMKDVTPKIERRKNGKKKKIKIMNDMDNIEMDKQNVKVNKQFKINHYFNKIRKES